MHTSRWPHEFLEKEAKKEIGARLIFSKQANIHVMTGNDNKNTSLSDYQIIRVEEMETSGLSPLATGHLSEQWTQ